MPSRSTSSSRTPTGAVTILSGSAHPQLGMELARELGAPTTGTVERYPDGELHVLVSEVQGRDVLIVEPLTLPIGESLLELVLLADACWRTGANSVSAIIPYLGYARQERRTREGEPLGAWVVARLVSDGHLAHIFTVDLHAPAVEGFFSPVVHNLSAVPLLVQALGAAPRRPSVVVAPDLGATKLARRFATRLGLPMAVVHKTRLSGSEVTAGEIVGNVGGLAPILVDDMISTGGTIAEAARAVVAAGAVPDITVAATHGLFVGPALDRLGGLPLTRLLVTDTLPIRNGSLRVDVATVMPLIVTAVQRVIEGRPLGELLAST